SWRSIIRSGETVVVPIGCSLIRCGISEPVTKTVRSSTFCLCFGAWLAVGSASTVRNHVGRNENCSAFRYRHLHEQKLHPGSCGVQIIEAMTMVPPDQSKRGNSWCHCLSADLTTT